MYALIREVCYIVGNSDISLLLYRLYMTIVYEAIRLGLTRYSWSSSTYHETLLTQSFSINRCYDNICGERLSASFCDQLYSRELILGDHHYFKYCDACFEAIYGYVYDFTISRLTQ